MRSVLLAWLLSVCLPAWSEAQALRCVEAQHPQMGTYFRITCYADDSLRAAVAIQSVFAYIDTLNFRFSDYLPESELNQLCAQAGNGKEVPVSPELFDILQQSLRFSKQSKGAFDVTIGPLTRLWRRARNLKELPDTARIAAAQRLTGYRHLHCAAGWQAVRLDQAGMQLDLGGIAQGWAADACLQLLQKSGFASVCIDAGGDIALGDAPPGSRGWPIKIPDNGRDTLIYLYNCGVTTSGATYRYFEYEGVRYSHIVDPATGIGMTHRNLVTIIADNATIADAWATALSVRSTLAKRKLRKYGLRKVWITTQSLN